MAQLGLIVLVALIAVAFCSPLQFEEKEDLKDKEGTVSAASAWNRDNQGAVSAASDVTGVRLPVAFSAYLSKNLRGLKAGQTIVFDRYLINDGDGYNPSSGVFTVPVNGVYSFTYFIGCRGNNQAFAVLKLDGKIISEAGVETRAGNDDGQGGNTSIFRADKGQEVKVTFHEGEGVIEGYDTYRVTTFSGNLLYVR